MKRFEWIFKVSFFVFLCSLTPSASLRAQAVDSVATAGVDSVDISLLTCGPGRLAYELYGHTALRVKGSPFIFYDRDGNPIVFDDVVANWGLFSFHQPYFVLRFVFGKTDYRMGLEPMEFFLEEYEDEGRMVYEQVLNLTAQEKADIIAALKENDKPENRYYRYNYFYDNCTTRADQMVVSHLNVTRADTLESKAYPVTYREAVHVYNGHRRWARLGNDLLLGWKADRPISLAKQLFLPMDLRDYYSAATITRDGATRPLVASAAMLLEARETPSAERMPSPSVVALSLLLLTLLLTGVEIRSKRCYMLYDAILLLAVGLGGLVLTAMLFSEHPTVQQNLQILLFNPLALILLYPVLRNERAGRCHWFWKVFAFSLLLFFLGNFVQRYAEGTNILALCLLIRCYKNIKFT